MEQQVKQALDKQTIHRVKQVLILLIILTTVSTVVLVLPTLHIRYICPIKEFMGFECPGCGGTRMVLALLRGNLLQAFRFNPFLFISLPIMVVIGIQQTKNYILIGDFSTWLDKVLISYAVMLLIFGIVRNISIFSWLKPTVI